MKKTFILKENKTGIIYYVDVTWGDLEFTYNLNSDSGSWDAENHVYTQEGAEAGWAVNNDATVTINNHSNAEVGVNVVFDSSKGAVSTTQNGVYAMLTATTGISGRLASAAEYAYDQKDGIDGLTKVTYHVTPGGNPENVNFWDMDATFDTIIVTISK